MQERDRRPGEGDVRGPTRGDFTDWDNPEDEIEEAPEGYYDEELDEEYELGPEDPDYVPFWVIVAISLLFIFAMLLPVLLRLS